MNLQAWVYATTEGCDDRDAAVALMRTVAERLRAIEPRRPGLGADVIAVADAQDYDDFDVEPDLVAPVTAGRLPFVLLSLSFDLDVAPAGAAELDALVAQYGFRLAATIPDDL